VARVYIENKSYEDVIACFDRPETFFYLDPPYYDCQNYYGDGIFSREDFEKLNGNSERKVHSLDQRSPADPRDIQRI